MLRRWPGRLPILPRRWPGRPPILPRRWPARSRNEGPRTVRYRRLVLDGRLELGFQDRLASGEEVDGPVGFEVHLSEVQLRQEVDRQEVDGDLLTATAGQAPASGASSRAVAAPFGAG